MAQRFHVIFEGRLVPGMNPETVKNNLKTVLKTDDTGIARLFSGKAIEVRRNVDRTLADKYLAAFKAAGAEVRIVSAAVDGTPPETPPIQVGQQSPPTSKPVFQHYIKAPDGGKMILTNIETVPGKTIIAHYGLVSGSTIRAKHIGRDIMAGLKNLVGGELKGYTELLNESRRQAVDRMVAQARQLGANAVVNIRFSTSSVAQGASELYAYGTAVKVE